MVKQLWRWGILAALIALIAVWLGALLNSGVGKDPGGITFGFAWGDAWLQSNLVLPNGAFRWQWYRPNLTDYSGIYLERNVAGITPLAVRVMLVPRMIQIRGTTIISFHLLLPLLSLVLLNLLAWLLPPMRRARRRSRGQCLSCGYDLRASTSEVCAECGYRNPHWRTEPALIADTPNIRPGHG